MAKRGLKLTAKEIYGPWGVSLKDAIVIVGGGSGEFISPEGLLLKVKALLLLLKRINYEIPELGMW